MKDISFRPTKLMMSLFEQIRKLDHSPSTDRNSIVERAVASALKNKNLDWKLISTMTVEEIFDGSIPKHIVLRIEEEKFNLINEQLKNTFNVEKITIPYTLKLLLVNYLFSLNQTHVVSVPSDVNLALFKNDYVQSSYGNKIRLLEACKIYLKTHMKLQVDLTTHATSQHKQLINFCDLSHYFPDKRTEFGTPTTTYLAKVLAGWFIFMVESQYEVSEWGETLDHIIKHLEDELQIKHGSPFEKIRAKKDAETTSYYKNVYSRVMSSK